MKLTDTVDRLPTWKTTDALSDELRVFDGDEVRLYAEKQAPAE